MTCHARFLLSKPSTNWATSPALCRFLFKILNCLSIFSFTYPAEYVIEDFRFISVHECFAYVHVCACGFHWNEDYGWFWVAMSVLVIEARSSVRAIHFLSHWIISLAPFYFILKFTYLLASLAPNSCISGLGLQSRYNHRWHHVWLDFYFVIFLFFFFEARFHVAQAALKLTM